MTNFYRFILAGCFALIVHNLIIAEPSNTIYVLASLGCLWLIIQKFIVSFIMEMITDKIKTDGNPNI